jgi:predicted transposase YbfD/YdcC
VSDFCVWKQYKNHETPFKKSQIRLYYSELQAKLVDTRDSRGKKHELAFVLLGFLIAVLRGCNKPSSIVRLMQREHKWLMKQTGYSNEKPISDCQFRRVIEGIDIESYNAINDAYFGIQICSSSGEWGSVDGKELRGSICGSKGEKRGESIVKVVSHKTKLSSIVGFYNATKESEKVVVKSAIEADKIQCKLSFDALHSSQNLMETIQSKQGIYLAQIKANQKHLLEDLIDISEHLPAVSQRKTQEKGHGRIEKRVASFYNIVIEGLDSKWKNTGIKTLIVTQRNIHHIKKNKDTSETAYQLTNMILEKNENQLFEAIRGHWSVESQNYTQDTLLNEDQIQCKKTNRIRAIGSVFNVAINLMRKNDKNQNLTAFREELTHSKKLVIKCFRT